MSQAKIELENAYGQALAQLRQLEYPMSGQPAPQRAIDIAAQAVVDLREQLAALGEE